MKHFSLLVFLISFLFFTKLPAQTNLDSLHERSIALRKYNPQKSFDLAYQAYKIAISVQSLEDEAKALRNMGTACIFLGKYNAGIKWLKKSLRIYEQLNDLEGISACLNNLAILYTRVKNLDQAAYLYLQEIFIDLKLRDTASASYGINNLAQILQLKGLYNYAIPLYKLSMEIDLKYEDSLNAATTMIALGNLLSELGFVKKSNHYIKQAITIAKTYDDPLMLAHAYKIAGNNYRLLQKFDSASYFLTRSLQIDKKYAYNEGLINSFIYYAYLLADVNELDSAQEYFFSAMNQCIQQNNQFLAYHSLLVYAEILHKQKQWQESILTLLNALEIAEQTGYTLEKPDIYLMLSENYAAINQPDSANHYRELYKLSKPSSESAALTKPSKKENKNIWFEIFAIILVFVVIITVWLLLEIIRLRKLRKSLQSFNEEGHEGGF